MGILFNEVDRNHLRVGDHIYSWRTGYTYAHHGIFVGDDDVIHFTRGSGQELGAGANLINSFASSSIPKQGLSCPRFPGGCGFQNENSGVMSSCLDCFLERGPVYRFEYGVCKAVFFAQIRGGTCTLAESDPPDTVIQRAEYIHRNGFGNYNIFSNNCEDFAIYCKTGFIVERNASGRSGQVAAMDGFRAASRFAYNHSDMFNNNPGLALINLAATYSFERYKADIGVRVDKAKVPVEDLIDCSTVIQVVKPKIPVEGSALYLDSSTSIRSDKSKVAVEDVYGFIDSSIGKKSPVEDLAVYLGSSAGIRDDKIKGLVEDVAVFVDSSTIIRSDKSKVAVKDVSGFLDSSTGKKSPMEDLAVYLGSSTGIRDDKIKGLVGDLAVFGCKKPPVEDAAVFVDSSSGKKPPVAESSTSQATRRNRRSKKQRQQHRRPVRIVDPLSGGIIIFGGQT